MSLPDFEAFWEQGEIALAQDADDGGMLRAFRDDPDKHPLPTETDRIVLHSPRIAGYGYADCPPHPAWLRAVEQPTNEYPLHLIANQPKGRLHSQLDFGAYSQSLKYRGREVCTLHPATAAARGIAEGDIVRIFNQRGACLAAARLNTGQRADVVRLPTGAWFDPVIDAQGRMMCVHGNPNVVTRDVGTSSLGQGTTGQRTIVQVERWDGPLPPVRAYDPPAG